MEGYVYAFREAIVLDVQCVVFSEHGAYCIPDPDATIEVFRKTSMAPTVRTDLMLTFRVSDGMVGVLSSSRALHISKSWPKFTRESSPIRS